MRVQERPVCPMEKFNRFTYLTKGYQLWKMLGYLAVKQAYKKDESTREASPSNFIAASTPGTPLSREEQEIWETLREHGEEPELVLLLRREAENLRMENVCVLPY